jgi:hypothetical protein
MLEKSGDVQLVREVAEVHEFDEAEDVVEEGRASRLV